MPHVPRMPRMPHVPQDPWSRAQPSAADSPDLRERAQELFRRMASDESPRLAHMRRLQHTLADRARGTDGRLRRAALALGWMQFCCSGDVRAMSCADALSYLSYAQSSMNSPSFVYASLRRQSSPLLQVTLMASLEHKALQMSARRSLWTTPLFSFTWMASWMGDDLQTLTAASRTCSASALEPLRRKLLHRLRPEVPGLHAAALEALSAFRRDPRTAGGGRAAVRQLRELCYGPRSNIARLREELVRGRLDASRKRRRPGGTRAPPDLSDDFCRVEADSAEKGLVATGLPTAFAPIVRLLAQIADAKAALLSSERSRVARQYRAMMPLALEIRAEWQASRAGPDTSSAYHGGLIARYAEHPAFVRAAGPERPPVLRFPELHAALERGGTCSMGAACELRYLTFLGSPAPRHHQLLLRGEPLAAQAAAEMREDIACASKSELLRRRHQVAEFVRVAEASPGPGEGAAAPGPGEGACCRSLILSVESLLEELRGAGDWSFGTCLGALVPNIRHQACSNSLDDDPRPRPLPLLSLDRMAAEENRRWLVGSLHEACRWRACVPPRIRSVLHQAYRADPSKISKSWAPICLHPHLEEPSEVPHTGPYGDDHTPLGQSRYFSWCPWQPSESISREEAAQMEAMIETMEPQEYWIQNVGSLKKDAIRAAPGLHQDLDTGHLSGPMKLSALCSRCGTRERPVAALWCACERVFVPQVFREKWHLPFDYLATPAWRGAGVGGARAAPIDLLFAGPRWLPPPPDAPPRDQLASIAGKARALHSRAFFACGGAWWRVGGTAARLVTFDALHLPQNSAALVVVTPQQRPAMPRRRPLDARFRRLDAERLMFSIVACTPLYGDGGLDAAGRRCHGALHLEPLPLAAGGGRVCIATTSRYAVPLPEPKPDEEYMAHAASPAFEYAPASLFEKRLLSIEPRTAVADRRLGPEELWAPSGKTPRLDARCAPSCIARASLRTVGQRVETKKCRACRVWQSGGDRCAHCRQQLHDDPCRACGELRHVQVSTSHGAEAWACARCGSLNGMWGDEAERHAMFHADDADERDLEQAAAVLPVLPVPHTLRVSPMHPALSAAWAHAVERLAQSHWIRSSQDGRTLDTDMHPAQLQRLLARTDGARTRLSGDHCESVRVWNACQATLRAWAVQHVSNDWRAAAMLLGMPQATGGGSLLQLLMASNMFAGQTALTLQSAARAGSGVVRL